jgi:L-ascorbate metabolism protein UlaG (beta-lactamase superfamily)
VGLKPFEKVLIHSKDGIPVTITATPCRHGPLGCGLIVGDVIGFMIEWPGQAGGALYLSGDTVFYSGLLEISRRFQIGTAFLNMGSAQMKCTGPVRYTLNSKDAALTAKALKIKNVIPLHYEGWSHFSEKKSQIEPHFRSENSQCKIQWLTPGIRTQILIQE